MLRVVKTPFVGETEVMVRVCTARVCGALETVDESMTTAFQNALVNMIDCVLAGGTPSDQEAAVSQLPPVSLFQLFVCA